MADDFRASPYQQEIDAAMALAQQAHQPPAQPVKTAEGPQYNPDRLTYTVPGVGQFTDTQGNFDKRARMRDYAMNESWPAQAVKGTVDSAMRLATSNKPLGTPYSEQEIADALNLAGAVTGSAGAVPMAAEGTELRAGANIFPQSIHEGNYIPHGDPRRNENLSNFMAGNHPNVPMVLYRGQRRIPKEDQFITQHGRATPSFASDPAVASVYSRTSTGWGEAPYGRGANVGAYHVSMKHPLDLTNRGEEISLGDLFDALPVDLTKMHGQKDKTIGYMDIYHAIENLDEMANKVGARVNVEDPDYGGKWVRNFSELADMIEEAGDNGDYEAINNALHEATLDTYLVGDHPGFVDLLERLGYDGIIHKDVFDAGKKYYEGDVGKLEEGDYGGVIIDAYRPFMNRAQVKSATGNRGTFDPNEFSVNKANGGYIHHDYGDDPDEVIQSAMKIAKG